jgi:hypothetical protein
MAAGCAACAEGTTCLRDVCVDDCGGDPAALDAELTPELRPVANLCRTFQEGSIAAHARDDRTFDVVHLHAENDAAMTTVSVDWYTASLATNAVTRAGEPCTTVLEASTPTAKLELTSEVGLSPEGGLAHFSLREEEYAPACCTLLGSRAHVVARDCQLVVHARPEYHGYGGSLLLLDEDPYALIVVSGLRSGAGGLGMLRDLQFLARTTGGDLRRIDDSVLAVVGGGHGTVQFELFPQDALREGPFPVVGRRLTGDDWPFKYAALEGRGIVGNGARQLSDDHYLFTLHVEGDPLPRPEPARFASAHFSRVVPIEGSRRVILEHPDGLLLVE